MRRDRLLAATLVAAGVGAASPSAQAYPTMITHAYTSCAQCHVDPSGAGVLTDYGRGQSEILVRTHYTKPPEGEEPAEPGKIKDFLFGAIPLPDVLALQIDYRSVVVPEPGNFRYILMQGDLRGAIDTDVFVASGSIGGVNSGAEGARLTRGDTWNVVTREYWAGVRPTKDLLVRAGRMQLPYGIRTEEHLLYTRGATRTDLNADQQVGLAVSHGSKRYRAEVMGIAGNYQVAPDDYRERGWSAYVGWYPTRKLELGVSSLWTTARADVRTNLPNARSAHGLSTRWSPLDGMAVLAEADLLTSDAGAGWDPAIGYVAAAQVDQELVQGLHLRATGQICDDDGSDDASPAYSANLAAQWFFLPRLDFRIDGMYGGYTCTPGQDATPLAFGTFHFFL